jgi:COP9 signalosome complex subunit 6
MEVDDTVVSVNKSVMASSGTVGSVSISLHPLVIMNISEHWTRLRAQEGSPQQGNLVFGYFLYKLDTIFNTFCVKYCMSYLLVVLM